MKKLLLSILLVGTVCCIDASDEQAPSIFSFGSKVISLVKAPLFGYTALAGLGLFGLYKLASYLLYQEEERMFDEHAQSFEPYVVTKKDFGMICDLINAMEHDMVQFAEQPSRVKGLELVEFDNEEMAKGCSGMRDVFCTLYEQCILEPENKAFLEEVIMIFKQTVEEGMVVA